MYLWLLSVIQNLGFVTRHPPVGYVSFSTGRPGSFPLASGFFPGRPLLLVR
jgi:hypothetical protein